MAQTQTRQIARTSGDGKPKPPAIPHGPRVGASVDLMGRIAETVGVIGDLSPLDAGARARYVVAVCNALGLNAATRPFMYVTFDGKLVLYARKECADQLCGLHDVSTEVISRERFEDLYLVTVRASMPGGRKSESTGAVPAEGVKGLALANAIKKAETQAKRRAVFSLVGFGWFDRGGDAAETDRHGNVQARAPERPLPASSATAMDIWGGDEEFEVTAEQIAAQPTAEDLARAAAELEQGEPPPGPLSELQENCLGLYRRAKALHVPLSEPPLEGSDAELTAWHDTTLGAIDEAAAAQPRGRSR